jgi:hypothetical protein
MQNDERLPPVTASPFHSSLIILHSSFYVWRELFQQFR